MGTLQRTAHPRHAWDAAQPLRLLVALHTCLIGACSGGGVPATSTASPTTGQPTATAAPASTPPSAPASATRFSAAPASVEAGGSTALSWSFPDADSCTASSGWSGSKPVVGSETVGPVTRSTTFTLTCSGAGGNSVEMLTVAVPKAVEVRWLAPTENVDGTRLTDLSGFRIHHGPSSRHYTQTVRIADPAATRHGLMLTAATYFIAMTSLDADGNESGYSNEVVEVVE